MATTTYSHGRPTVPSPSPGGRPASSRTAHIVVRVVLTAIAVGVISMWWRDTASLTGLAAEVTAVGRIAGLLGAYLVLVQLMLMSRLPWFERAVGFDRLAAWHRGLGTNTVLLLVVHVLFIVEGYALLARTGPVSTGWRVLTTYPDMLRALIGLGLFGLVAFTSARAARARLSYEAWYWLHLSVYAAVALSFGHQVAAGADFVANSTNRLLWEAMYAAVALSLLTWRVVLPARAWFTHRMLVERVVTEGPGVVSVWVRGHSLDQLGVQAGQFLLWRFMAPGHLWSAHPYSLSAAPDGRRLRITVKDAGDHSRDLARLRPGTPVLTEGPFGHFTADRRYSDKVLLVAGGSGIGPVRAIAEELLRYGSGRVAGKVSGRVPGKVVLLYRASRPADLVLRSELEDLASRYGLVVHYAVGRRTELSSDPLGPKALARLVPDVRARDTYVCGPPGMTTKVLESLRALGVPARQLHAEEFSL